MDTNSIKWLTDGIETAGSLVNQMQSWPSAVLLGVFLIIVGGTLKVLKIYPNKFIPVTLMAVGALGYWLTGDPGKVPPEQRFPDVILVMRGVVVAFGACLVHALILKRIEKYIPIFKTNGDTEVIQNPERQLTREDIGLNQPPKE